MCIPTTFNTQIFEKIIWVLKFSWFHVYGCFDCLYISATCMPGALKEQKGASLFLEMAVSDPVSLNVPQLCNSLHNPLS